MFFLSIMSGMEFTISFHSLPSRVSSSPSCCAVISCFSPHHHPSISSSFLQFHLRMRRTEMMNNFRIGVVNYIHIRTLRHPGNHISSHTDTISVRALDERSRVIVPSNGHNPFGQRRSLREDETSNPMTTIRVWRGKSDNPSCESRWGVLLSNPP